LVIWPVKIVPEIIYNVLTGTLSLYNILLLLLCLLEHHIEVLVGAVQQLLIDIWIKATLAARLSVPLERMTDYNRN